LQNPDPLPHLTHKETYSLLKDAANFFSELQKKDK